MEVKQGSVSIVGRDDAFFCSLDYVVSGRGLLFLSFCLILRYLRYLGELIWESWVVWYWIILVLSLLNIYRYLCMLAVSERGGEGPGKFSVCNMNPLYCLSHLLLFPVTGTYFGNKDIYVSIIYWPRSTYRKGKMPLKKYVTANHEAFLGRTLMSTIIFTV